MDAFFASVEQRDNPELRGKPVAVGGGGNRGVVAAASYEARKYGVRSAMSSVVAKKNCPHLIFVKPHFDKYKEASRQIHKIFEEYTDLIEPLSLDEAYLDVTENKKEIKSAVQIAKEIRAKIFEVTKLTASAGISNGKFIAKIASDFNKPNGLTFIKPENIVLFIEKLDIDKFYGIGKVTAAKMKARGIFTGLDLKKYSETELRKLYGKAGTYYYNISRGIDLRQVKPHRIRKSLGAERTFEYNLTEIPDMIEALKKVADTLSIRVQKAAVKAKTLTVKIKYADFTTCTRSQTQTFDIYKKKDIQNISKNILLNTEIPNKAIRLLGISLSNFKTINKIDKQLFIVFPNM